MADIEQLVDRAAQLQTQAEKLRSDLALLGQELKNLAAATTPNGVHKDCLVLALSLATDMGPDISSERPDDLAGRGDNWFKQ